MKNTLVLISATSLLIPLSNCVICPQKPFPILIGSENGDTKLTCIFQDDNLFYVGGTSSAPSLNGGATGTFKPIYHGYQVQDQNPVFLKVINTTIFTKLIAIKRYNDGLVLLTEYPHHLFRIRSTDGNVLKQLVMVSADDSPIDIILDEERVNNNNFQSALVGYISGAQETQILRMQDVRSPNGFTSDHSWTLNTGSDLEIQAVATYSDLTIATAALKYKNSGQFYYGFVDVDYGDDKNVQRYMETQGLSDEYFLMVADYEGLDRETSSYLGHNSQKTELIGFVVNFANSQIKSFTLSQTGSSLYPIYIITSSTDVEFSYADGQTLVYMKINIDSSLVTNQVFSNYISPGQVVTSRLVWQDTIDDSSLSGQILLSHGTQIGHRTYSQIVSQITLVNENLNCLKNLAITQPTITAIWTDYTVSTSQSNFVIGHDISLKAQDTSFSVVTAVGNTGLTQPCEIELDMQLAVSQSFYEHDSQSFSLTTQCVELTGCGATLTEELTTPQFASFPGCLNYDNAGTVNVQGCFPEGNYDIDFKCEMKGEELTDTQVLTIINNDLELTTCTTSFSVNQHDYWSHNLVLDYQQNQPTISNPSFNAFDTATSALPGFMSESNVGTTTTIDARPSGCSDVGSFNIKVDGQDDDVGSSTSCTFSLTVNALNSQPGFTSTLTDQVYQIQATGFDQLYTLPTTQDADPSDSIITTFTVDQNPPPSWITLDNGIITINTDNNFEVIGVKSYSGSQYDPYVVQLTLTDSNPCSASNGVLSYSESFNLRLHPFNHEPQIGVISDIYATTNNYQYIDLPSIIDEDSSDSLTIELLNKLSMISITSTVPGVSLDLPNSKIAIEVDNEIYEGSYQLRLQVTDDDTVKEGTTKTSYVDFQLYIGPFNFQPQWTQSFENLEFEMMNYSEESLILPTCKDQNPTDKLSVIYIYTQNGGPQTSSLAFVNEYKQNNRFYMDIEPIDIWHVGSYSVCVSCTDDDSVNFGEVKSDTNCFYFKVKGKNNAPIISKQPQDISLFVNETYTFQLPGYTDKDQYDSFEESVTLNGSPLPSYIMLSSQNDGSGPRLTIEPTLKSQVGEYEIKYVVTDSNSERGEEGRLSDSTSFSLTVETSQLEEIEEEEGEDTKENEEEEGEKSTDQDQEEYDPDTYVFEWPKTKIREPVPQIKSISNQGEVYIVWDQKILESDKIMQTSNKKEIIKASVISYSNQNANENLISYQMISLQETRMKLQLNFEDPLLVSATDEDLIQLLFSESFFLSKESRLKNQKNLKIQGIIPQQLDSGMASQVEAIQESQEATKGIMSALFGMNFFLSFFVSTILNMIWTLLNSLQLIMTLPLMAVDFPTNAFLISQVVNQVVNFNVLPVTTINNFLFRFKEDKKVKNRYFRDYSFEKYAMIENLELLFYIFVGILITALLLKVLSIACKKRKKLVASLIQKLIDFSLVFSIESYLEFLLSALTNIQQLNWITFGESLSSLLSLFFTISLILMPLIVYRYLKNKFGNKDQKNQKGQALFSEVKQSSEKTFLFNFYFLLRRMTHVFSLCFLHFSTVLQSQAIFALTFITELYLITYKPFKEEYLNYLEIMNEFFLHLFSYFCVLFGGLVNQQEIKFQLGWFYIYLFCFQVVVNIACIIIISIKSSKKCKKYNKKPKLQKKENLKLREQKYFLIELPQSSAVRLRNQEFPHNEKLYKIEKIDAENNLKPPSKKKRKTLSLGRKKGFNQVRKYKLQTKQNKNKPIGSQENSGEKSIDLLV